MATNQRFNGNPQPTSNDTGATVAAGAPIIAGAGLRVAVNDIADGASGPAYSEGVFTLDATSADVWSDGELLYWDAATEKLTDTAGTNIQPGHAFGDKAALAKTADIKLQPGAVNYAAAGSGSGS